MAGIVAFGGTTAITMAADLFELRNKLRISSARITPAGEKSPLRIGVTLTT